MIGKAGLIAVFAASVAAPSIAAAQAPWRQVYADRNVRVLFDTASATLSSPGTWTTVTSWDYAQPRTLENKKKYTRLVQRVHIRCAPVRVKRVRSTVYGANNALVRDEGEVDVRDQAAMAWDRPHRTTAAAKAFTSVCGILARKSPPRTRARTSRANTSGVSR
ncbi:MAG TPA: surface-adhesin E family protein [Gemmatimonadaceae bacterium]|nr:surface-adhesin E family protein [Gemmatimonadaceae bacterium]